MFDFIKGKVAYISAKNIVLENNDLGYIIHTSNPYSYKVGDTITVFTYAYIREDTFDLYGFITREERDLFIKLISVKGIGPKGALAILASGEINELENAIMQGDAKYLQKFPGIGVKASGQIILDLKGKIISTNEVSANPKLENVKEALRSLGYSNTELKKLDKFLLDNVELSIEELIKISLKKML